MTRAVAGACHTGWRAAMGRGDGREHMSSVTVTRRHTALTYRLQVHGHKQVESAAGEVHRVG